MVERDPKSLNQLTSENEHELDSLVRLAIKSGRGNRFLTFNSVLEGMYNLTNKQANQHIISGGKTPAPEFLLFDQSVVYDYLRRHQDEYNIHLFSPYISSLLDFPEGEQHPIDYVEALGVAIFVYLPRTRMWLKHAKQKPVFTCLDKCERGVVGALVADDEVRVLKHIVSSNPKEPEIAFRLGRKGLSPKVLESACGFIVEEYVFDPPIEKVAKEENPDFVGSAIGIMLHTLHEEGVVYNGRLHDHLLVGSSAEEGSRLRIINLSGAHWGDDFETDWRNAKEELIKVIYPKDEIARRHAIEVMAEWIEPGVIFQD